MSRQKLVYLDYTSTTPIRKEVVKAMEEYDAEIFAFLQNYRDFLKIKSAAG